MFKKVLVANRGEIAVRIMRTLKEMGIRSVAVCSEPDASALHVATADEVVCLGGAEPGSSYLSIEKVVQAARDTGAEAVHPGYGFLSENPALPEALEEAGITFIGPPADVMARLGNKVEARKLMAGSGVPVIPGTEDTDPARLVAAAGDMGFPVLVKAAGGGGGKGMRVVTEPGEIEQALAEASSEAEAAFGDGTVYLERYLERPRHVEFQVLADAHGAVVHLFDRECSIQRRHQKIIEESPSPALDDDLRRRMGEAAVAAARAAGYVNAGTVEFLLDQQGQFYFLEVNARLQVEHPITEMVTGVDLVRLQLEVAAGQPLGLEQQDLHQRGHAIECRIYAEDPRANFAPSPGRILCMRPPSGPGIRHDEGVHAGFEVPMHYDPILCKLVAHAQDRPAALARMVRALEEYVILGVDTPIRMMIDLISSEEFVAGDTHTGMVPEFLAGWTVDPTEDELALLGHAVWDVVGIRGDSGEGAAAGPAEGWPSPWKTLGKWDVGNRN